MVRDTATNPVAYMEYAMKLRKGFALFADFVERATEMSHRAVQWGRSDEELVQLGTAPARFVNVTFQSQFQSVTVWAPGAADLPVAQPLNLLGAKVVADFVIRYFDTAPGASG
jgi:hypothetical protein